MFFGAILAGLVLLCGAAQALVTRSGVPVPIGAIRTVSVTPHMYYSAALGVVGCKVNTNRVMYFPLTEFPLACDSLCYRITNGDRSIHLVQIDWSQGAHDISYDAFNYLVTGKHATEAATNDLTPTKMKVERVDMQHCVDDGILDAADGNLAFSAWSGSGQGSVSARGQPLQCRAHESGSWIDKNSILIDMANPMLPGTGADRQCTLGDMNLRSGNPDCPGGGTSAPVEPLKGCSYANLVVPDDIVGTGIGGPAIKKYVGA